MKYIIILFIFVLIYIYYRNISEKYNPNISEIFEKCWDLSNLKSIVVYKTILPKIKIGNKHDGGYVIIDNLTYDYYISCGIERDISFDDHFLKKYPNINGVGIDGSIDGFPYELDRFKFIKKFVGSTNDNNTTNLIEYTNKYNNIFLKMDIEEWEFEWLQSVSPDILNKFKQITIELHFDPLSTGKYSIDEKLILLNKLSNTHWLVHAHPNNWANVYVCNNIILPHSLEVTYIRKDVQSDIGFNEEQIPSKYDNPNSTSRADISLSGYPYTV